VVDYWFDQGGNFDHLEIVSIGRGLHPGGSKVIRKDAITFKLIWDRKGPSRPAFRSFIRELKWVIFDDMSYRMSKKRCEDFFDNESNFAL